MAKDLKNKKELQRLCGEKYKLLFSSSPETILILNKEGRVIEINNSKLLRQTGYKKAKIIGIKIPNFKFIPKGSKQIIIKNFTRRTRGENVPPYEVKFKDKKGEDLWIKINVRIIKNKQKKIVGFFVILIDVTKQKEEEIIHQTLFKTAIDAIMFLKPPKWRFTSGNPSTIKMFGVKNEEEFASHGPYDYSPKYQANGKLSSTEAKRMISKAMKKGSNTFEWIHKTKWGKEFPTIVFLKRVNVHGHKFLQATVRDVTEQKRREESMKREKEMSEKYFNAAGVVLGVIDLNSNITTVNKKGLKILDYKEKELIGKNWINILVPKRKRKKLKVIFKKILTGKMLKIASFENLLLTKKGAEKIFIFNNTILKDSENKISGILLSAFDVTRQKEIEKEIKEKTIQLEKMNEFFLNREERVIELKEKIKRLEKAKSKK